MASKLLSPAKLAIAATLLAATFLTSCAPVIFAGAAAGGTAAISNRTPGAIVEDEGIELKVFTALSEEIGGDARFSAVSINRVVLVVGQAPDETTRDRILEIIKSTENVRKVHDQLTIGPQISLKQQLEDSVITTKVKAQLIGVQKDHFSSVNIKVLTEDGVVYLMGLDTKDNAALAVEYARSVEDVRRVVKAFEYIPDRVDPQEAAHSN